MMKTGVIKLMKAWNKQKVNILYDFTVNKVPLIGNNSLLTKYDLTDEDLEFISDKFNSMGLRVGGKSKTDCGCFKHLLKKYSEPMIRSSIHNYYTSGGKEQSIKEFVEKDIEKSVSKKKSNQTQTQVQRENNSNAFTSISEAYDRGKKLLITAGISLGIFIIIFLTLSIIFDSTICLIISLVIAAVLIVMILSIRNVLKRYGDTRIELRK